MNLSSRILIVDREPAWRNFVAKVLGEEGYSVFMYEDIDSTLSKIATCDSDLILTDAALNMLINKLARDYPETRFIVFTAAPSVAEALAAFRRGAIDYESKSFDPAMLVGAVRSALRKSPVRARRFVS